MSLQEDIQKSTAQLQAAQQEEVRKQVLYDFFRSPAGQAYSPCQANVRVLESYLGTDAAWSVDLLTQAAGFIDSQLAASTENSARMRAREDREREEQAEANRIAQIQSHNARLKSMSKEELRIEAKRVLALKDAPRKVVVDKTRAELLAMSRAEFKALLAYPGGQSRPGVREEVDRILQEGGAE